MPTGTCQYPQHHGPSAGPPAALVAAIIIGALIVVEWHTVLVTAAVVATLVVILGAVVMLVHSHRAVPYDAYFAEDEAEVPARRAISAAPARDRTAALEAEVAALRARIGQPQQHLHIHGVTPDILAAALARQPQGAPLKENPW